MLKILRAVTDKDWSGASRYNGHISADESVSRSNGDKLMPLPTHAGLDFILAFSNQDSFREEEEACWKKKAERNF
jgi:hypothetical protein